MTDGHSTQSAADRRCEECGGHLSNPGNPLCDRCWEADYGIDHDPDELDCTHCGGEPHMQECDDPIQCCNPRCDGTWHPCDACNGTGLRSQQWFF